MIRVRLVIVEEGRFSVSSPPRGDQLRKHLAAPSNDDPKRSMLDAGIQLQEKKNSRIYSSTPGYTSMIWHLRKGAILRFFNANEFFRNAWSHAGTITRWTNLVGLLPHSRSSTTRDVSIRYTLTQEMSTSSFILKGYTTKNDIYAIQHTSNACCNFDP
jgi:hypothetical protein